MVNFKWIQENTEIKVLLIGDGSDEFFFGIYVFSQCKLLKIHILKFY